MDMYKIFFVGTARPRPGKDGEAAEWWKETGQQAYESFPGVKSLRTLAGQFGLAGQYSIEFWYEIEDYAVMDRWDEVIAADPQKYGPLFQKFGELFETGPSRLLGSWPESRLTD
jgi:hypothetical protein